MECCEEGNQKTFAFRRFTKNGKELPNPSIIINDKIGIFVSCRDTPRPSGNLEIFNFRFTEDQKDALQDLAEDYEKTYLALICRNDVCCLNCDEYNDLLLAWLKGKSKNKSFSINVKIVLSGKGSHSFHLSTPRGSQEDEMIVPRNAFPAKIFE